jgi:hypothetical protein
MMAVIFGLWALATFAGLWAHCRRSNPDAVAVGGLLLIAWVLPYVVTGLYPVGGDGPERARSFALLVSQALDVFMAFGLYVSLWRRCEGWRLALVSIFFAQGVVHLTVSDPVVSAWLLNIGYGAQLLAMVEPMARDWSRGRDNSPTGWHSFGGAP